MGLLARILPLAALAYFWVHMPSRVKVLGRTVLNGPKAVMTSMDMDSARTALAMEFLNNERWPGDISSFLQVNVQGVEHPDRDRWGTPYRLENVPEDPVLVSCGADTAYSTADDMRVKIIRKKKPGETDDSSSGSDEPKLPGVE
jgi:hypothetical protein